MWHTKRPIKFRGMTAEGEYVYGDLISVTSSPVINYGGGKYAHVYPLTVDQLCGLDMCRRELYEGDVVLTPTGDKHVVEIYNRPKFLSACYLLKGNSL